MRTLAPLLAAALVVSAGCERRADVDHPRTFAGGGISFAYPGNWKVSTESSREGTIGLRGITVQSPGDGLVMIQELTPAIPVEAASYLDKLLAEMNTFAAGKTRRLVAVQAGARKPLTRQLLGEPRAGQRATFQVTALGEKVPHTMEAYAAVLPDRTLVFVLQVPDEDRPKVEPGFAQILDSVSVP